MNNQQLQPNNKKNLRRSHMKIDALMVSIFFIVYVVWFFALEHVSDDVYHHIVYSKIDDMIPFCSYFVVPYILWFAFIPVGLLSIYVLSYKHFRRSFLMLATGMIASLIIYMIYPNEQVLRVAIAPDTIFNDAVLWFYNNDTNTNVCPSIHALNSWVIAISIVRARIATQVVNICVIAFSMLIALSTVFLKQHSIVDVLAAAALTAVLYICYCVLDESIANVANTLKSKLLALLTGRKNKQKKAA
jgi:membrane-associated phospholipid phosphatase